MSAAEMLDEQRYVDALNRRRMVALVGQTSQLRLQIVATTMVVVAIGWPAVPWSFSLGWMTAVLILRELRVRQLRRWAQDESTPIGRRMPAFLVSSAIFGAACGSGSLFMLWLDPMNDALLTMVLMSWAAGAVSTTAPLMGGYIMFSAFLYAPAATMWLLAGTPMSVAVAALVLMFAGVQYRFARQNATVFEESFRIRRENEDLVRQLGAARDRAESAVRAKVRFLAAASHDLRQPLHALTLHSGLLALDPYAPDAPRIVRELSASIESLARLLDSLLDISKLDAGVVTVTPRRIVLARLLGQLVHAHQPQARLKGLALRFDCPSDIVVETDPLLLERLLRNLLDNALKYTDSGEVCLSVDGNTLVELKVRDTGRGIPADAMDKVFEEFFRVPVHPLDHQPTQGLGLGLAIVKRLALLLGLPLRLDSTPNRGTTVTLVIARADKPVDDRVDDDAPSPSLQGLRVLLVEDEAPIRRATRQVLDHFGCSTRDAADAAEAEALARRELPDLILADFRLGGQDSGLDLIRRLRAQHPDLPALLITGDTGTDRLSEAERSGLSLLHKPVNVARLRAAMHEALGAAATAHREGEP